MNEDNLLVELIDSINKIVRNKSNEKEFIPLHEPSFLNTKAKSNVNDCIDSGWVSSAGTWVNNFEHALCDLTKSKNAIAVVNGTVALRLALYLSGVRPGDEVLVTPLTFIATVNAISHLGAFPHFIDIESDTLGISPVSLENRLNEIATSKGNHLYNKFTNRKISAILPVHVFGNPINIGELLEISERWNIPIVEDAAEALGSWHKNNTKKVHCGLSGKVGILSFNGNKIITTGGGGALITNDSELAQQARHLSTTAKIPHAWNFFHDEIGWNDRMPNINAALGCAQLEAFPEILSRKKELTLNYRNMLSKFDFIEILHESESSVSNNWLVTIRIKSRDDSLAYDYQQKLLKISHSKRILLRPAWQPLHTLPIYSKNPRGLLANAEYQAKRLINLPSSPKLKQS